MSTHEKETFEQVFDWAQDSDQLPWAQKYPMLFLADLCERREPGTALDIGCGAGIDAVYLAQQGWQVTALDFVAKALEYTEQAAAKAGVSITPVVADITVWRPPEQYDLVLDHGLLHNMDPERHAEYRECVLQALGDDADFLLLHWHPMFAGQADGRVGPTRRSREDIREFFAPELKEDYFALEDFEDLEDAVGGSMAQAHYWFRRSPA